MKKQLQRILFMLMVFSVTIALYGCTGGKEIVMAIVVVGDNSYLVVYRNKKFDFVCRK